MCRLQLQLDRLDPDGRVVLKWTLTEQDGSAWIGLIWLVMGKSDSLLQTRQYLQTFGFYKFGGISCLAQERTTFEEGFCFLQLVAQLFSQLIARHCHQTVSQAVAQLQGLSLMLNVPHCSLWKTTCHTVDTLIFPAT